MDRRLLLCFTYIELGLGDATAEHLHQRLRVFSVSQCLRLFSALNALLRDETEPVNIRTHNSLVRWLFTKDVGDRIIVSGRVGLYRQQLLYMAKAALLSCEGDLRSFVKADYEEIGLLCLMASDLLPVIPQKPSSTDFERAVRVVLHFAPIQESALHHPEHNITRAYLMLTESAEKLRDSKTFVDVKQLFEQAVGLAVEDYFALMFATLTRFMKFDPNLYAKNPQSYAIDAEWFSKTKVNKETVLKLLDDLSASPKELREDAKKETGPSDFTVFRKWPLVRDEGGYYPVDFEFLASKTEAHIYWTVLASVSGEVQGKFQSFWGKVFEQYIADLLTSSANAELNRVYTFVREAGDDGKEMCDAVVHCGEAVVLIECKGTMFRGDAKYKGEVDRLEDEVTKKFVYDGKAVGVSQLASAVRTINENRNCASAFSFQDTTIIFPMLVIRDDIGNVFGLNRYLGAQFEARLPDRKKVPFAVAPLICTSAEGLERWCSYLSDLRLTDILRAHLQANKNVTDPLLRLALPLPPFAVGNAAIEKIGEREARLHRDWKKIVDVAISRLGLELE